MSLRAHAAFVVVFLMIQSAAADSPMVPSGTPMNEPYRAQFQECDEHDSFGGIQFPIRRQNGSIIWFGCRTDPSKFTRFERIDASPTTPEATILQSKLGWDEDGSPKACGSSHGITDQCPTSLMLNATAATPCVLPSHNGKACVPLNADEIPYVVIPAAAPHGIDAHEFESLSKLRIGDYGVVIANGKTVPVIIGDEGPAYKIGEGSTALLKALSTDHKVHTFGSGVVFVLFPGSLDPVPTLQPETLANIVSKRGADLYSKIAPNK
jgi:Fungal chitosanase of glycosyl hydrolase group 75